MVNDLTPTPAARLADPGRLLRAYQTAASTLNLLRAFATGGEADLQRVHDWNRGFVRTSPAGARYEQLAREIDRAMDFMRACGVRDDVLHGVELFCSHEALILEYERALTRPGPDGRAYDLSGHFVWVGDRTRVGRRRAHRLRVPAGQPDRHEGRPDRAAGGRRRAGRAARPGRPCRAGSR